MPAVAANSRSAADDDLSSRMVACRRGKIEPEGFALVRGADQAVALRRQREAGRAEFPVEPVENRRGIGGAVEIDRHRAALIALGVDRHVCDLRSGAEMDPVQGSEQSM